MAKKITSSLLLIFMGILVLPKNVWSQGSPADLAKLSLEDLMQVTIESVSKFEQKVVEAPASVTIITSDDIKKYGYRTFAEILRSVRGLYVGYDRNYSYIGLRGFSRPGDYNTRVLMLVDGHRMNDNIYDYAAIGGDFILDVDLIDRVEVIRGPASSLYGTNAFLGTINVKTKTGRGLGGFEASAEGGRFYSGKGRVSYGNKFENGVELLVSASGYDSQGDQRLFFKEFNSPATNFGIAKDADEEDYASVFTSLLYQGVTITSGYVNRVKSIPTASFGTLFNDDRSKTFDRRGFVDLKYERQFASEYGFTGRLFYDSYYYRGNYRYDYAAPGDPPFIVTNRDIATTKSAGTELQLSKTVFGKHKFILGIDYEYIFQQDQKNFDIATYLDDQRKSSKWAAYVQDGFELFKDFRVTAGVRYDRYSTFGGTVNPRVGLVYKPFEKTITKLLYGQAFRAPNDFELHWSSPNLGKTNSGLSPETVRSVEFVLQQYLGFNLWGTANLYYQRIKDLITQTTDPTDGLLVFQNTGSVDQKGLEVELEGRWESGIRGRMSYAVQRTEDLETGTGLTNSPVHLSKFNGIVPLYSDKLFIGLEEQYTSRRKTLASLHTGGYWLTNVALFNENWFKGLELSASIYNLFGKKYGDPGAGEHVQDVIRQDGRSFRFKLTYRF